MNNTNRLTLFLPLNNQIKLAQELSSQLNTPTFVEHTMKETWPNGETYDRIDTNPRGKNIVIVGSLVNDSDILRMYELGCACQKYGAYSLTFIIPFFGYSTMERADPNKGFEVVKAKTRARLLSSIPAATAGNNVLLLDLHTDITHYFENSINPIHLYSKPLILPVIKEHSTSYSGPSMLASPDAGRAKWTESLAKEINWNVGIVLKERLSGSEVETLAVSGIEAGSNIYIFDDMIRSGSTLIKAASAFKKQGANDIFVVSTHGDFCGEAPLNLLSNGISKLFITNSHPKTHSLQNKNITVLDCSSLFIKTLTELLDY